MNQLKKLIKDVKNFFFKLWVFVFFATLVYNGSFFLKLLLLKHVVLPRLKEYQKVQLVVNSLMFQLFFLQDLKAQLFHLDLNQKPCKNTRILHQKFCALHHSSNGPRFPKSAIIIDTCRYLAVFLSNYWFDFYHRVQNQKFHTCRGGFD